MNKHQPMILGFALALAGLVLAGCSLFGPTGQDKAEADTLAEEIADYKQWRTPAWVEGFQPSAHPIPEYVRYYVNDIAMSDLDHPPDGSVFVKEQFDQDKQLINFTVMKKIDGYDPDNNDWFWAIADKSGRVTDAGRLNTAWTSSCIDCHKKGDGGGDLLFVND